MLSDPCIQDVCYINVFNLHVIRSMYAYNNISVIILLYTIDLMVFLGTLNF